MKIVREGCDENVLSAIGRAGRLMVEAFAYLPHVLVNGDARRSMLSQLYSTGIRTLPVITVVGLFTGMIIGLQVGLALRKFNQEMFLGATVMISLLRVANRYIDAGRVKSIRCSTRPDYIDSEILSILKAYRVDVIELGLQSSDNNVLALTKRGHTVNDALRATALIKQFGFTLVGQMMIGLPGSTAENELKTAEFIVKSGAEYARIYPTIVFRDTELYAMSRCGAYTPISIEDAIVRSAAVLGYFMENGVNVIRIGLCSSENLISDKTYFAGPNHPALGELIVSRYYYNKLSAILKSRETNNSPRVLVAKGHISRAIGQHRSNKARLISEFGLTDIDFKEDESLSPYELKLLF